VTIRRRLALWYTGVLLSCLAPGLGWAYFEIFYEYHDPSVKRAPFPSHDAVSEIAEGLLIAGIPALLFGVVGGRLLLRRTLDPIASLSRAAARIHGGNLRERLPTTGNRDEIDRLTQMFNAMMDRIESSFGRIREFTLHASHELKTPLTVIRGELETAIRKAEQVSEQGDWMLSLLDEVGRLTQIVDGLTFLSKADSGLIALEHEAVPLHDVVREASLHAEVLGEADGISAHLSRCDEISVVGDRRRLRQLLLLLVDNATKYNQRGGSVGVSLEDLGDQSRIVLRNTGPGIPQAAIGRVFDRFYRARSSHSKEMDGCGLGLSLAHSIVCGHGGEISIDSELGHETTVTVLLPIEKAR